MRGSGEEFVFVLVHGTWAPGAAWTLPGSWLRVRLRRTMLAAGAARVDFARTVWSGANGDAARLDGSRRLRARIAHVARARPDAHIVVVGHSHGGNVALHAVGHCPETRARVRCVGTLATPFLGFERQRPWVAGLAYGLEGVGFVALVFGLLAVLAAAALTFILHDVSWYLDMKLWIYRFARTWPCRLIWFWDGCRPAMTEALSVMATLMGLLTIGGLTAGSLGVSAERVEAGRAEADAVVGGLTYFDPSVPGVPVLVLTASADEALQVMTGALWTYRAAMLWVRATVAAAVAVGVAVAAGGYWLVQRVQERALIDLAITGSAMVSLALVQLFAVPALFGIGALLGLGLRRLGERATPTFDTGSRRLNLFWSRTASRRLPAGGYVTWRNLGWAQLRRGGLTPLHSRLYTSSAAVREITDFAMEPPVASARSTATP